MRSEASAKAGLIAFFNYHSPINKEFVFTAFVFMLLTVDDDLYYAVLITKRIQAKKGIISLSSALIYSHDLLL